MNPTMDEILSHFAQRFKFNEDAVRMSCKSSYSTANWIYGIADVLERMSPHTLPDEDADFAKVRRTLTWTAMTNIAQNNYRDNYRHALLRMLYPYRFHNTTKDAGVVLKKSLGNPDNLSLAPTGRRKPVTNMGALRTNTGWWMKPSRNLKSSSMRMFPSPSPP